MIGWLSKSVFMLLMRPIVGPALIVGWIAALLWGNSVGPDRGLFSAIIGIVVVLYGGLAVGKALARARFGMTWRQEAERTWLKAMNRLKGSQL